MKPNELHIFRCLNVYRPAVLDAWYGLFKTGKPEYFGVLIQPQMHNPALNLAPFAHLTRRSKPAPHWLTLRLVSSEEPE